MFFTADELGLTILGMLQRSALRRKINREEHAEVTEQFMRRVWVGRKLKVLVRRRALEVGLHVI